MSAFISNVSPPTVFAFFTSANRSLLLYIHTYGRLVAVHPFVCCLFWLGALTLGRNLTIKFMTSRVGWKGALVLCQNKLLYVSKNAGATSTGFSKRKNSSNNYYPVNCENSITVTLYKSKPTFTRHTLSHYISIIFLYKFYKRFLFWNIILPLYWKSLYVHISTYT